MQYRFPRELAEFPSREFYEGRLQSAIRDSASLLAPLLTTRFPWPKRNNGVVVPTVFVPCSSEEDMGGRSKGNAGQVEVVMEIIKMLTSSADGQTTVKLDITVLSPYTKQVLALRHHSVAASTVDSFQGRESQVIIFSSVRSNVEHDIGFVDDARRLNVMWTRAQFALIIVGDEMTMSSNPLWKRAIESCEKVIVSLDAAA